MSTPREEQDHLDGEFLSKWPSLPFAYQMKLAHHVSTACENCWSTIRSAKLDQPLSYDDPFLRALARVRFQPKLDLSLPSQAIRLFLHPPFLRTDFPRLLLQESIELGLESPGPYRVAKYLGLPSAIAELLRESFEAKAAGADLKIDVGCAAVHFYLHAEDTEKAEKAFDEAREHLQDSSDDYTRVSLKLAEFSLTCKTNRTKAMEVMKDITDNEFPGLVYDPVRRFEVSCVLAYGLNHGGPADNVDDATSVLSELGLGSFGDELQRLNALFVKARFARVVESLMPDLPEAAASELEREYESVKRRGDAYTQGLYHQLLGELRRDKSSFRDALDIYSTLELERPFLEAWLRFDSVLGKAGPTDPSYQRSEISNLAQSVFGNQAAQRMARTVYTTSEREELS